MMISNERLRLGYIRCSTAEQNPLLQGKDVKSLCPEYELQLLSENESAWKENVRPVFDEILKKIKSGRVSDFYCWDLDRVYRNLTKLKGFFLLCKTFNCRVHSYNQQWLEGLNKIPYPFGEMMKDMMISVIGWISEMESTKKSARVKIAVVKEQGKETKSYKGNRWGRKPFPKQTIDRVTALHKEGKSIREISKLIQVYDKNNNSRNISKSAVHKITTQNTPENHS